MIPLPPIQWLRAPANRTIIERWTRNVASGHRLHLPGEPTGGSCVMLVVGDTGDSEVTGSRRSPQVAIAESMALEAGFVSPDPAFEARPETPPRPGVPARLVLHTGDVVYMSGERRLYDRNFRRPYGAFLTRESTYSDLVFRLPFLPVPGKVSPAALRAMITRL